MQSPPPLLELRSVSKRFEKKIDTAARLARVLGARVSEQTVHAVDQVSIAVHAGEVVGLVGESGCGKSTLGRVAAGLHSPSEGARWWCGEPTEALRMRLGSQAYRREMLGIQMVFQDPYASLNPRLRVEQIIGEAPVAHGLVAARDLREHAASLLDKVGLDPQYLRRFAHQFSGGQRARIGIARALAVSPRMLVCDEAVAALDVSIQAQVINLFMDLREQFGLTYLFISHDLGVVRHISDRVVVMYLGRVVESAPVETLFKEPAHPYTRALLAQAPRLEVGKKLFAPIRGEIPSPLNPPRGCHFHPRCAQAMPRCVEEAPSLTAVGSGHTVACHLHRAEQPASGRAGDAGTASVVPIDLVGRRARAA